MDSRRDFGMTLGFSFALCGLAALRETCCCTPAFAPQWYTCAVINREKVIHALEAKRSQFEHYRAGLARQQALVDVRLAGLLRRTADEILAFLAESDIEWPGSLPTVALDAADTLRLPFGVAWESHEAARGWARQILEGRPVVAVDGSQVAPSKDLSIPVGAVQVGWYINYHTPGGRYVKDVAFEVLTPDELNDTGDEDGRATSRSGDRLMPDWRVNQRRFEAECERLCALMTEFAGWPDADKPLCFFDGSFIVSFAGQMQPSRGLVYVDKVRELLDCSAATRVPLVAFVDRSYSRDLVNLVDVLAGESETLTLSDAALLQPLLPNWGDRSPLFLCARADQLSQNGHADFYQDVAFTYVHLNQGRTPARVELPRWLVEEGRAEDVLNLVRAECVVGAGYPYAVETADQLAVISQADRERFYLLFEQFLSRDGLVLVGTRKAASKAVRR